MRRVPRWLGITTALLAAASPAPLGDLGAWRHDGPSVAAGEGGPARFVRTLLAGFSPERALELAAFADRFYRAPGNEGYEATLDRFAGALREHGWGSEGFDLELLASEMDAPAWTPRSARLALVRADGREEVLHAFDSSEDADRTMLPLHAPSARVRGPVVLRLGDVRDGTVLVTEARLAPSVLARARERGAVAVVSAAASPFGEDPTGAQRHLDAILYTELPDDGALAVAQISPRAHERIVAAAAEGAAVLELHAEVARGERSVRTLCATLRGRALAGEAVVIASHVQEPGAGDNASGAAGLVEIACALARAVRSGDLEPPARSIVFLWGDEMRQSRVWLERGGLRAHAAISADMLGQSPERTGSIALLERMHDPGALTTLPPDAHTPWGAGEVSEEDLVPSGLAVVARVALADVAARTGGWRTAEHPWEGGSDHDVFLERGIPAVLVWHFTDFTYHTSLDRMDMLDGRELERSCAAVGAIALAVASPRAADLGRYLRSNELERALRVRSAEDADAAEVAERWNAWCDGAEVWLRELCEGAGAR